MKKYCDWWLLPLLACLLAGCGDDDYHYPSVKLEFLTAFSGADGYLQSVVTDEGETLPVVEDKAEKNTSDIKVQQSDLELLEELKEMGR